MIGNITNAAGQGYTHVKNDTTNVIDKVLFLDSPSISGTIFLLEHNAAQTNVPWHSLMDTRSNSLNKFGIDILLQQLQCHGIQIPNSKIKKASISYKTSSSSQHPATHQRIYKWNHPVQSSTTDRQYDHVEFDSAGPKGTNGLHTHRWVRRLWRIYPSSTRTVNQHGRTSLSRVRNSDITIQDLASATAGPLYREENAQNATTWQWHDVFIYVFVSKVIVKRSGQRPTKGDPYFYDGRFFRFGRTDKNIVYFDETTQRENVARHYHIDEFHYDSHRSRTSPGTIGTTSNATHSSPDGAYWTIACACWFTTTESASQHSWSNVSVPNQHDQGGYTATAAPIQHQQTTMPTLVALNNLLSTSRKQKQEKILDAWVDTNRYSDTTTVCMEMNLHPPLGFYLTEDTEAGRTFMHGCQEGTSASRLPRWKSQTMQHSALITLNNKPIRKAQFSEKWPNYEIGTEWIELLFAQSDHYRPFGLRMTGQLEVISRRLFWAYIFSTWD